LSETRPRREFHPPLFGIFLLFLGIIFLLQNLGVLSWGLWQELWRFWPVLVIGLGLRLLMKNVSPWLVGAIFFVLLCASLGVAIWQYGYSGW